MKRILLVLFAVAIALPAYGGTLFYSGDLRTGSNITACGSGCTLQAADTDATWAQWAGFSVPFTLASPFDVTAITYGFAGGTSATGAVVAAGGFEPYFSLFDASGNFLDSTYLGTTCPAGAGSVGGNCYDVKLDAGTLAAGSYTLVLTAYENMSLAENTGSGTLADGFTGLGNLNGAENLNYAFDLNLPNPVPTGGGGEPPLIPEPPSWSLLLTGLLVSGVVIRQKATQ